MSDNKQITQGSDRTRIALGQEHEVKYWTKALGVTREQLEQAVNVVGNSAERVRAHLARNKH